MILKRNKIILFGTNNINFIILILPFLFKYICTATKCHGDKVKSDFYKEVTCTNICEGDNVKDNREFYVKDDTYECLFETCQRTLVYSTNECIDDCYETIKIGDYCFFPDEILSPTNYSYSSEKCYQYTSITYLTSKKRKKIDCFYDPDPNVNDLTFNIKKCNKDFYDIDSKYCIDDCPINRRKRRKTRNQGTPFTYEECTNQCEDNEIANYDRYCIERCDTSTSYKFFYYVDARYRICRTDCDSGDFYESDYIDTFGYRCGITCVYPRLFTKENNYFKCFDKIINDNGGCPSLLKKFINACVENCKETKDLVKVKNILTYYIKIGTENKCVEKCYLYGTYAYNNTNEYECIQSCKTINKVVYEYECHDNCPNNKNLIFKTEKENECVNKCPYGYFESYNTKECVTACNNDECYDIPSEKCQKSSGYFKLENNDILCYHQCPSYTYHENGSRICKYFPPPDKCFFEENNFSICYLDCQSIPTTTTTSFKYEDEHICYRDYNCGDRYYYKNNGITYCIPNKAELPSQRPNYIRVCTERELYYLRGKECISGCNLENEYVIFPTNNSIYLGMTILGACCPNPNCNKTYKFYSEDHILRETCIYKTINGGNAHTRNGNCVQTCPPEYPYENEEGDDCSHICNNKIYYIGNTKKCVSSCKSYNKYFFEGEKDCLDSCKKTLRNGFVKYYYYQDSNNQCYTSCKLIDKFSFKNEEVNYHQKCLSSCPDQYKYYYKEDYICLNNCGNGFIQDEEDNKFICVHQCQEDELIVYNKFCRKKNKGCPNEEPFITFTTVNGILSEKCVSNCITTTHNYIYGKRCYIECPSDAPFHFFNSNMCITKSSCGPGHYISSNICYSGCPNDRPYFISETNNNFKCVPFCDLTKYYISSTNECVLFCNIGENFIGKNKRCKNKCSESDDGKYYIKYKEMENYNIYLCIKDYKNYEDNSLENHVLYLIEDTNEVVPDKCPSNKPYASYNGFICLTNCLTDSLLKFSTEQDGKKICSSECINPNYKYYYKEDKICLQDCSIYRNDIINDEDNTCVFECNITSKYKFKLKKDDGFYHCSTECKTNQRYFENDYICLEKCPKPYNFVYKNKCLNECPKNKFSVPINKYEYECKDKCEEGNLFYFAKDRICKPACGTNFYSVQYTNECVLNCTSINSSLKYHFYDDNFTCMTKCPSSKPFLRENNHCNYNCNPLTYKYHIEREYNCLLKCPINMTIDNDICTKGCPKEKFLDRENNKCINSCLDSSLSNFYYVPLENICLKKCNNTSFTDGYKCVNSCMFQPNIYLDETTKKCLEKCPENRNFVIDKFNLGEDNVQRRCLENCTFEYPFYTSDNGINYCRSFCPNYYYYPNIDQKIPIKCYPDRCPDGYIYFVKYSNGSKQCFEKCPENLPFYDSSLQCYEKCPKKEPYHKFNTYKCGKDVNYCDTKIIDYNTKECVFTCPSEKVLGEKNGITFCLDRCNLEFGEFLLNGKCINSCIEENLIKDLSDPENKKCICKYLYYIENGKMKCYPPDIKDCNKTTNPYNQYRIFNSNQCSNYCLGFLSPNEDICYQNSKTCDDIDINYTTPIIFNNKRICYCKYRYYVNSENKKVCIEDKCSLLSYQYYIPSLKECVHFCKDRYGGIYKNFFDGNCYEKCSEINMVETKSDECECENNWNWIKIGESGDISYKCIDKCDKQHPYLIEDTKQCVKNCTGLKYNIFYKNKCYSSCPLVEETLLIKVLPEDEKMKEIAPYTCQCGNLWYYDNGDVICTKFGTIQNCSFYKFKFLVRETNQCTNSCPDKHPYFYNKECFSNCSIANINYQYPVKEDEKGSKRCTCQYLWKRIDNDTVECLKNVVCDDLMVMINETKECVNECPFNYPLLFNGICYKKGNCPDFSEDDTVTGKKCVCTNLWHKQSNGHIYCLEEEKCPSTHIFKNSSNKECVSDPGTDYILNYTLYKTCPKGTVESNFTNEAGKSYNICECDPTFGYWYRNKKDFPEIICQLNNCNSEMNYHNNRTKECLSNCEKNKLYSYENICYEDQCPNPTVSKDELNNKYICIVKKYSTSSNLTELYEFLKEEIVTLYGGIKDKEKGLIYKNFSTTMQIYGIGKDKIPTNLISRAGLSYINITDCIEKIFENNKKGEIGDIILVKFDLENQPYKSLINPVEYEFISSVTGQVLDASVCNKNNIIISYSLSYILNHYSKSQERKLQIIEDEINLDKILFEVQRQYKDGKRIATEYNLDSFDINSTLYKDNCLPFEINGNDLVIDDRIKYLFPYYSLCEENCTYDHIDYEYERIYCNCTLKNEFNLEREHKFIKNPYENEEVISRQKGPTNFYVMQCFSKLNDKKNFLKNPGFFYSLAVILFEIILFFVTILYNYKILKNKINKNSLSQEELGKEKEKEKEINLSNIPFVPIGHKKKIKNIAINEINKINIQTSEKSLNASPPKKREIKIDTINLNDVKVGNNIIMEKIDEYDIETDDPRINSGENIKDSFTKDNFIGIIYIIQKEHQLLRIKFELVVNKDRSSIFTILLTEICDKIYLIKTLCLLGKYDMLTIYLSLYILCHILLLTFITFFYDIKTIKEIWNNANFPNLSYHLLYGLINYLMIWFIYKIFLCLLNNDDIIQKYSKNRINTNVDSESENVKINRRKYNHLLCKIKCGMISYFIIQFILVFACSIYLTMFCVVYIGTKRRIFKTYGIALAEVIIIKVVYGLILGTLRKIGLTKEISAIYKIAYYLDKVFY